MGKRLIALLVAAVFLLPVLMGMTIGSADDTIVSIGKNVTVEKGAYATNNVVVIGGSATIKGQVSENVVAVFGNIYLEPGAVIRGDAVAVFGSVIRQGDAQVYGESVSVDIGSVNFRDARFSGLTWPLRNVWRGTRSIWGVLSVTLFGLLIFWLAPRPVKGVAAAISVDPLKSVVYGILAYLALVPLTIVMLISLLGIPLIPFLWGAVAVGRFLGQVSLGLLAGRFIFKQVQNDSQSEGISVVVGLMLLGIITLIPIAGGFAGLFYSLAGFGAVIWTRFGRRSVDRAEVIVRGGDSNV